jgi:uncharacterized SAM-binding protein YcdF (DUF218 family)
MKSVTPNPRPQKFFKIFSRRERWGLSGRGWLVLLAVLSGSAILFLLEIRPFLAVTDRADANYLVMEGWVHMYAAQATAAEFRTGKYQQILITGLPVEGSGEYDKDSNTESWVGAGLLLRVGIPEEFLQRVPCRKVERNRTYSAALKLKEWFQEHHLTIHAINIITEDAHARRTRLLFQEAFGPDMKIGVISVPDPDYDPKHWWRYSEGVREIMSESIAYIYAKFFFYPGPAERGS